jgi:hypothetical protein
MNERKTKYHKGIAMISNKDKEEFEKWFKDIWAMPDDFDEGHTIKPEHE